MRLTNEDKEFLKARLIERREITACECWEYTGCRDHLYGAITFKRKSIRVHRVAAALWKGFDLQSKLCVLHVCDNPPCFNPDHLRIGTQADNIKDCQAKGRTRNHCSVNGIGRPIKLTADDVRDARAMYRDGVGVADIAKQFNVSRRTMLDVVKGRLWRHVP